MRPSLRWRLAACALLVGTILAGCTTSTADDPTSTVPSGTASPSVIDTSPASPVSSVPASPSPSVIDASTPPTSPTTLDPEAQEIADRAAVEAQYLKFWDTYENIVRTQPGDRANALGDVSVDPLKTKILDAASNFDSQGLDYYGAVVEHPYWIDPIAGGEFAVMRDCQDQSQYGSVFVASGEKRTVGVEKINLQVGFVRGPDEIWRAQNLQHLTNVPC